MTWNSALLSLGYWKSNSKSCEKCVSVAVIDAVGFQTPLKYANRDMPILGSFNWSTAQQQQQQRRRRRIWL